MEPVSLTKRHHKLRQKPQIQTTSKTLKHKLCQNLKHKLCQKSQIQTTLKASNTNCVKSLKHKLRQNPQAQTKHLTL